MASPSPSPTSSSFNNSIENVTSESYRIGYTMLCDTAVSTYIPALSSWTTFTPATCSYNRSLPAAASTTPSLSITATGITTPSPQETALGDVSTVTEFSSTMSTTTITGSLSTSSQTSNAPRETFGFGMSGLTSLAWIIYFGYKSLRRWVKDVTNSLPVKHLYIVDNDVSRAKTKFTLQSTFECAKGHRSNKQYTYIIKRIYLHCRITFNVIEALVAPSHRIHGIFGLLSSMASYGLIGADKHG